MDRMLLNFVYAFILTRSRLLLIPVMFCLFVTELWPLSEYRLRSISLELGVLQHENSCSGDIVRFSDKPSHHLSHAHTLSCNWRMLKYFDV